MIFKNKFVSGPTITDWIEDLAFLVDITTKLNVLDLQNKVITNIVCI